MDDVPDVQQKRKADTSLVSAPEPKKQRMDLVTVEPGAALDADKRTQVIHAPGGPQIVERTSDLSAPTLLLSGHQAAIYSVQFSPDGKHMASAGVDRLVCL